jgi:hypothetical protein
MDGDVFLATQEPQDNYYWCIQNNPYGSHGTASSFLTTSLRISRSLSISW